MAKKFVWPKNYIAYAYDNFLDNAGNANAIASFYASKGNLLSNQFNVARQREEKLMQKAGTDKDFKQLLIDILNPKKNALSDFINAGRVSTPLITTSRKVGSGLDFSFYSSPTALANMTHMAADKWLNLATNYSQGIESLLGDVSRELKILESLQAEILEKWAFSGYSSLTQGEQDLVASLRDNFTLINMPPKSQRRIVQNIAILKKAVAELARIGGSGATNFKIKSIRDLSPIIKQAVAELGFMTAEATGPIFAATADLEGLKAVDSIGAQFTGSNEIIYKRSDEYRDLMTELGLTINEQRKDQKADNSYIFTKGKATFRIGASVKRGNPRSLKKYGLNLMSTNVGLIMDQAGIFSNTGLLNAIMNAAAGHEVYKSAEADWGKVKEIITLASLLFALTGASSKNTDSNVVMLIINNKPVTVSEVIRRVMNSNSPKVVTYSYLDRMQYVAMNEYKGNPDKLSGPLGIKRSEELNRNLMRTWSSQSMNVGLSSAIMRSLI